MTKRIDPRDLPRMLDDATAIVEYGISQGLNQYIHTLSSVGKKPGSLVSLWFASLLLEASIRPAVRGTLSKEDMTKLVRLARDAGAVIVAGMIASDDESRADTPTVDDAAEHVLAGMESIRATMDRIVADVNGSEVKGD